MDNIKWAIMNSIDVNGDDPHNGISMVISDTADAAIDERIERFKTGESDNWDKSRGYELTSRQVRDLEDSCYMLAQHIYYYTKEEPDREIHSVFTAWPVYA